MLVLFWFLIAAAAALPNITVEQTAKGYVARVATFDMRQQLDVDAEIERRATNLCHEQQVHWSEFRSVATLGKNPGSEPAPISGYSKEFTCVATDDAAYASAPTDWQAKPTDLSDANAVFESYYSKRDSGDFDAAFSMFAPDVLSDRTSWAEEMAAQNKRIGSGKRRVTGITWYVNPDQAPHPGIYVAIDFVGEFPKAYFYCGYVVLYRRAPGTYEMTREEQNIYTHGDGTADAAQIAQMKATMCRGS